MDHTPFIVAAYAVTLLATGALLGISWIRMRRAEGAIGKDRT